VVLIVDALATFDPLVFKKFPVSLVALVELVALVGVNPAPPVVVADTVPDPIKFVALVAVPITSPVTLPTIEEVKVFVPAIVSLPVV
jgi:hypothetical protein